VEEAGIQKANEEEGQSGSLLSQYQYHLVCANQPLFDAISVKTYDYKYLGMAEAHRNQRRRGVACCAE
jgi:hypothetical protein